MEIFEVRLSGASEDKLSELTRCLRESFADLHIDGRLETDPALGAIVYRIAGGTPDEGERLAIHSRAAEGMAEYVLSAVEPELIRIMIRKYYPCGDDDTERIAELCMRLLGHRQGGPAAPDGPLPQARPVRERASRGGASREQQRNGTVSAAPGRTAATTCDPASAGAAPAAALPETAGVEPDPQRGRRKRHIAAELLAYLQERPSLHLEGYITFRLDKYWEELAEAAEAAVDEFVMDRQYREFVGLLSEFVGRQQPRVSAVNLVLKADGGFALYDEAFRPMDPADGGRPVPELMDEDLNIEDMVVSCLIAISPRAITLHARNPELPVVKTIGAIFAGRVTVCEGCFSCRPLTGAVPH